MQNNSEAHTSTPEGMSRRHDLTQAQLTRLTATKTPLGADLAQAILGQAPGVLKLVDAHIDGLSQTFDATLNANTDSQKQFHQMQTLRMEALKSAIDKASTQEERLDLLNRLDNACELSASKDTENKQWLKEARSQQTRDTWGAIASTFIVALLIGAASSTRIAR